MKQPDQARLDPSDGQRAPAVTRTIDILRLLARSDRPLGVNAIAARLDLIPSTCLHILRALVEQTVVSVEPITKQYSLGPGLLSLAHDMLRKNTFINVVQPVLDSWAADPPRQFPNYASGSAGPHAADALLQQDGRAWRPLSSPEKR